MLPATKDITHLILIHYETIEKPKQDEGGLPYAIKEGLFTARLDLDEGDTEYQLYFFNKLFNSIFTKVCEAGHFGGLHGKTYDVYVDIVSSYSIPEDKLFCPFLFPLQYAKAMSINNPNAQVLDESLAENRHPRL